MSEFETQYNDPLRSLELTLVQQYRQFKALTDWQTLSAVNDLIRVYTAEQRRRQPPQLRQDGMTQHVFDQLAHTSAGWLGREPLVDEQGTVTTLGEQALSVSELIACLKRVRKSIEMWKKEGGNRGYFEFVDRFFL